MPRCTTLYDWMSSVMGVQYVVEGVAIAEPHAAATNAIAAANIFTLFIIFSFSSLILNGVMMKSSLVPPRHVLLKLTVFSRERANSQNILFTLCYGVQSRKQGRFTLIA